MKRNTLIKTIIMAVLVASLLLQGCEKKATTTSVTEPATSTSSVETTTTTTTTEPAPEPEPKQEAVIENLPERTEDIILRLIQQDAEDPLVIDVKDDGSFRYYTASHADQSEVMNGYWSYLGGELCFADTDIDELLVNSLMLYDGSFEYNALNCAGFAYGEVVDKAIFKDSENTPDESKMEEYQDNLGGAPFHARIPGKYAMTDDRYLGFWEDVESGWFEITVSKAGAEIGGYTINLGNVDGECLIYGDAHIDGDALSVHQINNTNQQAEVTLEPSGEGILLRVEGDINIGNAEGDGPYTFVKEFKR